MITDRIGLRSVLLPLLTAKPPDTRSIMPYGDIKIAGSLHFHSDSIECSVVVLDLQVWFICHESNLVISI